MNFVLSDRIAPDLLSWGEELAAIRRDIHRTPELGFDTAETTARIVKHLASWDIPCDAQKVKGGVIAVVEGAKPGPTVALRADIDALPMPDETTNPWRSTHDGKAHACGHDGHQTWLLGALRWLKAHNDFAGRVIGIFQPAEEIAQGADAVIASGVLADYDVREIYGAHTEPMLEKGVFGFKAGPLQAASDSFWITVKGVGTHGGRPHLGVDPIPVGGQIINALQTLVSRKLNPVDTGVVSICSVNAGSFNTPNVIPPVLTMSGTVRTFSPDARDLMERELTRLVTGIADANGCAADVKYVRQCAAVINPELQTQAGIDAAIELYGADHVVPAMTPFMSSEDFSAYQHVIPGAILRVGVKDEAHQATLHSRTMDFNDEVLPAAAQLLATIARKRLAALA